jgi:hypothetical protein
MTYRLGFAGIPQSHVWPYYRRSDKQRIAEAFGVGLVAAYGDGTKRDSR